MVFANRDRHRQQTKACIIGCILCLSSIDDDTSVIAKFTFKIQCNKSEDPWHFVAVSSFNDDDDDDGGGDNNLFASSFFN